VVGAKGVRKEKAGLINFIREKKGWNLEGCALRGNAGQVTKFGWKCKKKVKN